MDDKIVGWDAVNNQPITTRIGTRISSCLKSIIQEHGDERICRVVHARPNERRGARLAVQRERNAELMKEYERREKVEAPQRRFYKARRRNQDEALLSGMSPEERGKMDKSLTAFQRKVMNAMLGGSQADRTIVTWKRSRRGFDRSTTRHLKEDKAKIGKDSFVHAAGSCLKERTYRKVGVGREECERAWTRSW